MLGETKEVRWRRWRHGSDGVEVRLGQSLGTSRRGLKGLAQAFGPPLLWEIVEGL